MDRDQGERGGLGRDAERDAHRQANVERTDRSGYGDDQGTHVGRPASPERGADRGPGHGTDAEPEGRTLGMGAEAAEGIHGARGASGASGGRDESDRSSLEGQGTGRGVEQGAERAGSEPLEGREREHRSGYGGSGGRPVSSSDAREGREGREGREAHGTPSLAESEGGRRDAGDANRRPRAQDEQDL